VLDLNGLAAGTHDVVVSVVSAEGQIGSVSPSVITVTIRRLAEETEVPITPG
jgi:hypothetical protein